MYIPKCGRFQVKVKLASQGAVIQHRVTRFKCLKGVSGSARASREAIYRNTILGGIGQEQNPRIGSARRTPVTLTGPPGLTNREKARDYGKDTKTRQDLPD
jgi:hypothetical protein